jgi:acetylglutamate kinase
VYKLGGPALEDSGLVGALAAELRGSGRRVAVVHGGGRNVERLLGALGIESRFVDGRRETSPSAMEVVEMVLSGKVNKALAAGLTEHGVLAVGISGRDGGLIRARPVPGLGRVGTPVTIEARPVLALWDAGLVPVISPVSMGPGGLSLNVNADEAACGLARALGAKSLVYLSDIDGVQVDGRPVESLGAAEATRLIANGTIAGGMALKVQVALAAAADGIEEVVVAGKQRLVGAFAGTRIDGERRAFGASDREPGARA